jgi:hypothetical protein
LYFIEWGLFHRSVFSWKLVHKDLHFGFFTFIRNWRWFFFFCFIQPYSFTKELYLLLPVRSTTYTPMIFIQEVSNMCMYNMKMVCQCCKTSNDTLEIPYPIDNKNFFLWLSASDKWFWSKSNHVFITYHHLSSISPILNLTTRKCCSM